MTQFGKLAFIAILVTIILTSWNGYETQLDRTYGMQEKNVCTTDIGKQLPECIELSLSIKAEASPKVKSQPKQSN